MQKNPQIPWNQTEPNSLSISFHVVFVVSWILYISVVLISMPMENVNFSLFNCEPCLSRASETHGNPVAFSNKRSSCNLGHPFHILGQISPRAVLSS